MSDPAQPAAPKLLGRSIGGSVAAVLLALAFPPHDLLGGWLAIPALAGLIATFRGLTARRGALVGLITGMAFFLVLLTWLRVLGPDAWVALSLLCAAFWAGQGALLPSLLRRRWWVLTVPALWVCVEALRGWIPWGGFPWGRLAFGQAGTALMGWAALGGATLVSFVVALAATCLLRGFDALHLPRSSRSQPATLGATPSAQAHQGDVTGEAPQFDGTKPSNPRHDAVGGASTGPTARQPAAALGWVAAIVLLALGGAAVHSLDWSGPDGPTQPIAIVQGNVPRLGLDFNAQRRAVLDGHVLETEQLATEVADGTQPQPVAVIWPENSSDIDPLSNADAALAVSRAAQAIDAPILVGAIKVNPADPPRDGHRGTILNVGLVWDPVTGPGQAYAKRHPVPFGEYLPFRSILTRFISRFDRIPRDFVGGTEPGFLQIGPVPAGVVICFEIAYDELVRDAIDAGGQVLVVQTNNATYGHTGLPEQQLAITRVQAVTTGRSTLVAATSGISAVIAPDGELTWETEEFTRTSTVADVPMRTGLTPAMRLSGLPTLAAAALLVGLLLLGRRKRPAPVPVVAAG